jgi:hypothetical protein
MPSVFESCEKMLLLIFNVLTSMCNGEWKAVWEDWWIAKLWEKIEEDEKFWISSVVRKKVEEVKLKRNF